MSRSKFTRAALRVAVIGLVAASVAPVFARDGDPDRSFGENGSVFLSFPGGLSVDSVFADVKVLTSGKLLVSATVRTGTAAATDMGVMRLDANGSIDTSFGVAGARVIGFDRVGSDNFDTVASMAIQPNGRILLAGYAAGSVGGTDMAIVRLNADGSLDSSFGSGGKTTVAFDLGATAAARTDLAYRVIVLADGRIVLGGVAFTAAGGLIAVARLTAGGVLDPTFDGDGKRTLDFGGGLTDIGIAYNLLASADGTRLYVIGSAALAGNYNFAVARLLGDGSLDAAYAGDGSMTFGFDIGGDLADTATEAVELPGGKLLTCGISEVAGQNNTDFACIRLRANGTVDSDFLPALIPFDLAIPRTDQAYAMRLDARGQIVLAGLAAAGPADYDFAVARLLPSGQVDPTFGIDGRMTYDGEVDNASNTGYSLAMQDDDKMVVAGPIASSVPNVAHVHVVRVIGDTVFEDDFDAGFIDSVEATPKQGTVYIQHADVDDSHL